MKQKDSAFLKMPAALLDSELSLYAVVLYTALLDRAQLSRKNKYQDEQGIYVFCTLEEAGKFLRCSRPRAVQTFEELCKAGYLSKRRLGRMHSNKYYIKELQLEEAPASQVSAAPLPEGKSFDIKELDITLRQKSTPLPSEVKISPVTSTELPSEVKNSDPNHNYIKQNNISHTDVNHAGAQESEQKLFLLESDPSLRRVKAMKHMSYFPRLMAGESKESLQAELEALLA